MLTRAPILALGVAMLALPALTDGPPETWLVSPAVTESSRTQAGPGVETVETSPFYSDIGASGIGATTVADEAWSLFDGVDSPHDADPRDEQVLPRPVPALTFELR